MTDVARPRTARMEEIESLERLIESSARALSRGFYSQAQIDAAVAEVFGVDTDLVADRSYFVIEAGGRPVACGGWSRRRTLFGGNQFADRSSDLLDPATEAARIRAFFVAPDHARRGLGRLLLDACIDAARGAGFGRLALMATLPGVPLYRAMGFVAEPEVVLSLSGGSVPVPFVPMQRDI